MRKEKMAYFIRHYIMAYGIETWFELPFSTRSAIILGDMAHWEHLGINPLKAEGT